MEPSIGSHAPYEACLTGTRDPSGPVPAADPISRAQDLISRIEQTKAQSQALLRQFQRLRDDFERIRAPVPRQQLLEHSPHARMLARLETMPVIEQAKGIIMAQSHCGDAEAFDILRRASQRSNVPVRELATRIVASTTRVPAPAEAELRQRHGRARDRRRVSA